MVVYALCRSRSEYLQCLFSDVDGGVEIQERARFHTQVTEVHVPGQKSRENNQNPLTSTVGTVSMLRGAFA
jgi:hypothetical protein